MVIRFKTKNLISFTGLGKDIINAKKINHEWFISINKRSFFKAKESTIKWIEKILSNGKK